MILVAESGQIESAAKHKKLSMLSFLSEPNKILAAAAATTAAPLLFNLPVRLLRLATLNYYSLSSFFLSFFLCLKRSCSTD